MPNYNPTTYLSISCLSFIVQLNELSEFSGGGTRFSYTDPSRASKETPSAPLSVPAGHAALFTGKFYHDAAVTLTLTLALTLTLTL